MALEVEHLLEIWREYCTITSEGFDIEVKKVGQMNAKQHHVLYEQKIMAAAASCELIECVWTREHVTEHFVMWLRDNHPLAWISVGFKPSVSLVNMVCGSLK